MAAGHGSAAADFAFKAGNKPLEVIRAEPAQVPLRIAVLVSDAGTGGFQQGLGISCRTCSGTRNSR